MRNIPPEPLPHGADLYSDLRKRLGNYRFKTVFDVGANAGQSALEYLQAFPEAEIYSFEPVAATYQGLVEATHEHERIHTFPTGMGSVTGEAIINVNPRSVMSSIGFRRPQDVQEAITLDTVADFAARHGIETIDFLKVDTEGHDLEVLAGAASLLQQQLVRFVQCECEPTASTGTLVSFADAAAFLGRFGYQLFGIYDQQPEWWEGTTAMRFWNAVFIAETVFLANPGEPLRGEP
jgi:FkbM family methyltransferase